MAGTHQQLILVRLTEDQALDDETWPGNLAAVRDLVTWGEFAQATVFVGENGVGKSTIVEALAVLCGFPLQGGSRAEQRHVEYDDTSLANCLDTVKGPSANVGGFFLRAETMHNFSEYLSSVGSPRGHSLQRCSHGESFLDLLTAAHRKPGLWILDEPESALSFAGQLTLLSMLIQRMNDGH